MANTRAYFFDTELQQIIDTLTFPPRTYVAPIGNVRITTNPPYIDIDENYLVWIHNKYIKHLGLLISTQDDQNEGHICLLLLDFDLKKARLLDTLANQHYHCHIPTIISVFEKDMGTHFLLESNLTGQLTSVSILLTFIILFLIPLLSSLGFPIHVAY